MGQKVNPVGFRTGYNVEWKSLWFSSREYGKLTLEDKKIRDLLKLHAQEAGISDIKIERSPNIKVTVSVARPGVIIGRGGAGLTEVRDFLSKAVGSKVDILIEEIKKPELSAKLVSDEVVRSILRRMPVKRIMHQTCERVMGRGAKGVKMIVSGVIGGPSSIHRTERVVKGSVPTQTIRSKIDFAR